MDCGTGGEDRTCGLGFVLICMIILMLVGFEVLWIIIYKLLPLIDSQR